MIDRGLADALGVVRDAPPDRAAAYLLRQGDGDVPPDLDIPVPVAEWLLLVAAELHAWSEKNWTAKPLADITAAVGAETLPRLRLNHAPIALALIGPRAVVRCDARQLHRETRLLVERCLPGFCEAVYDTWQRNRRMDRRLADDAERDD